MPKKTLNENDNPLVLLFKILTNALLDDPRGINRTAKNALLIMADVVQPDMAKQIEAKIVKIGSRYKYDQ